MINDDSADSASRTRTSRSDRQGSFDTESDSHQSMTPTLRSPSSDYPDTDGRRRPSRSRRPSTTDEEPSDEDGPPIKRGVRKPRGSRSSFSVHIRETHNGEEMDSSHYEWTSDSEVDTPQSDYNDHKQGGKIETASTALKSSASETPPPRPPRRSERISSRASTGGSKAPKQFSNRSGLRSSAKLSEFQPPGLDYEEALRRALAASPSPPGRSRTSMGSSGRRDF